MNPESFAKYVNNNDTGTSTPSELAMYARMTNYQIAGYAHKFAWSVREYSLTLTGASSYDLLTLIPDLSTIYRPYGTAFGGNEPAYRQPYEFNVESGGQIITIVGKTLKIKNAPGTGTLTIPYYSNYLVANSSGTRQKDFLAETDVSVIPDTHIPMLVEGIQEYIDRREHRPSFQRQYALYDGRIVNVTPFFYLLQQAAIDDNPMQIVLTDWRSPA